MSTNRPIPAMYQGVSQQPASQRALEQCESLINGYPTVADGERKRPPTQYVKKLTPWTPENAKVHQYFRGDGEHNVILIGHNGIGGTTDVTVWDGATGTVKVLDYVTYPAALAYLQSTNPMDEIDCLTVADTTFLWNRTVTTAMLASTLTAQTPMLYLYVKEGAPDTDYTVDLSTYGVIGWSTSTAASSYSTTKIALELRNAINALAGAPFVAVQVNNLVTVRRSDNSDFQFTVFDSRGSSLMAAFKNRVERYADLPRFCSEDVIVEVRGQGDAGGKGAYWVKFKRDGVKESGYWEETTKPDTTQPTKIDPATMPVIIVRRSDGTFQLKTVAWDERLVGATVTGSAPIPSFIGGKIAAMFFTRNRLGLLSGESVVMSRSNNLYNFWPKSVAVIADDDPIDATVSTTRVTDLAHAAPLQRQVMLFSASAQFPLTSGNEALTAKTVRVDSATEYDCSPLVRPVSSGHDLFFVFERSSAGSTYSGVREYTVDTTSVTNTAVDITAHVAQFLPRNIYAAFVSSTEDLLLLLSKETYQRVYFYKYLWSDKERVQSAWGYWEFRQGDKILSASVEKTTVTFVIQRVDGLHIERMELQSAATTPGLPFQVMLDSLALLDSGSKSYNATTDSTTFVRPYPSLESMVVAGAGHASGAGQTLKPFDWDSTTVQVRGNWTVGDVWFGVPYAHRHTFSEIFMRDQDGRAIQQGRLQLKHVTVAFKNAVTFRAEVTTPSRDLMSYPWTAFKLGIAGTVIGSPVIRSGSFTFPVASKSDRCSITLVNDSPYPATFYAAEWEGEFITRSQRR